MECVVTLLDKKELERYTQLRSTLPLTQFRPSAGTTGFPSPADSYLEPPLNLEAYLQLNKSSIFMARASGDSMMEIGIHHGDLLIIDRSLKVENNDIIVCSLNGELVVKRFYKDSMGQAYLLSANAKYKAVPLNEEHELVVWGVCTTVIKEIRNRKGYVRNSGL